MQDRLYIVRDHQTRKPDVAIVRSSSRAPYRGGGTALLEMDTPAIFETYREEIRQPLIEIVEPAAGNKIVTAIEVLSPDNKSSGPGRTSYLAKRDQYRSGRSEHRRNRFARGRAADGQARRGKAGVASALAIFGRCFALAHAARSLCVSAGAAAAADRRSAGV